MKGSSIFDNFSIICFFFVGKPTLSMLQMSQNKTKNRVKFMVGTCFYVIEVDCDEAVKSQSSNCLDIYALVMS